MGQRKRQNILIPQLNISANDDELRIMQKKLLSNQYQQQINEHKHNYELKKSRYNPQQQDTVDHRTLNKLYVDYEKGVRSDLANSYQQQINFKNQLKVKAKQKQRKQEQDALKRLRQMQIEQYQRSKALNQSYKRQAQETIIKRQKQKREAKKKEQEEKKLYRQRYSQNNINYNKQRSFDEHYINVQGAQNQNEKQYLQFVLPKNKRRQQQKQKIVDQGIKKNQILLRNLIQKQSSQTNKQKFDLKATLQEQIRQKQQKKRIQKSQYRGQSYANKVYAQKYHPIYNPVNFRITHDNKYIMKEIQAQFQNANQNMSGLARSGSQAILS